MLQRIKFLQMIKYGQSGNSTGLGVKRLVLFPLFPQVSVQHWPWTVLICKGSSSTRSLRPLRNMNLIVTCIFYQFQFTFCYLLFKPWMFESILRYKNICYSPVFPITFLIAVNISFPDFGTPPSPSTAVTLETFPPGSGACQLFFFLLEFPSY